MNTIVVVLILIISVFLVLIVLMQDSKGGGLASSFSAQNQYMGVRKTTSFLEKATWTLAGILLVLCIVSSISIQRGSVATSAMDKQIEAAPVNQAIPDYATQQPEAPVAPAEAPTQE